MFNVDEILKINGLAKDLMDAKKPKEIRNVLKEYDIKISEEISDEEIQNILDGTFELSERDLEDVSGGIVLTTSVIVTWTIAYGTELFLLYQGAKAFSK